MWFWLPLVSLVFFFMLVPHTVLYDHNNCIRKKILQWPLLHQFALITRFSLMIPEPSSLFWILWAWPPPLSLRWSMRSSRLNTCCHSLSWGIRLKGINYSLRTNGMKGASFRHQRCVQVENRKLKSTVTKPTRTERNQSRLRDKTELKKILFEKNRNFKFRISLNLELHS